MKLRIVEIILVLFKKWRISHLSPGKAEGQVTPLSVF